MMHLCITQYTYWTPLLVFNHPRSEGWSQISPRKHGIAFKYVPHLNTRLAQTYMYVAHLLVTKLRLKSIITQINRCLI